MRYLSLSSVTQLLLGLNLLGAMASAAELLQGTIELGDEEQTNFTLSGENRQQVIGGAISLGDKTFTITNVSRLGLIGADRRGTFGNADNTPFGEFVIFSSSFSTQTATGQPWVVGKRYINCDRPYNSFLAVYRVDGAEALEALAAIPYSVLSEDVAKSDDSAVYCFISKPPA